MRDGSPGLPELLVRMGRLLADDAAAHGAHLDPSGRQRIAKELARFKSDPLAWLETHYQEARKDMLTLPPADEQSKEH